VRMHCAFEDGGWAGAYSAHSPELETAKFRGPDSGAPPDDHRPGFWCAPCPWSCCLCTARATAAPRRARGGAAKSADGAWSG